MPHKVGDRVDYQGTPHTITAFDFIFEKVTLRPFDESKPIAESLGPAVVIPLKDLPQKKPL